MMFSNLNQRELSGHTEQGGRQVSSQCEQRSVDNFCIVIFDGCNSQAAALRSHHYIVGVLDIGQGTHRVAKSMSAVHVFRNVSWKTSAKREAEHEGSCHCPCLASVTSSNDDVHPADVRTAAVVGWSMSSNRLIFMVLHRRTAARENVRDEEVQRG
ncbi:hypothetical protein RB195_018244 [Necator americanus]|uniref:Uncharacterized protein n=1 Tax=Necator americanus TaxID=51031 RepID=A0ABR1C8U1_NECAM